MKASEFCYWLQGYFEVSGSVAIDSQQAAVIQRHLSLVFKHDLDPKQGTPEYQAELQAIHDGVPLHLGKPPLGSVGPNGEIMRC